MKRFWLGFGIGMIAGVLFVVGGWYVYARRFEGVGAIDRMARRQVEDALPSARVLDVSVQTLPESTAKVNYVHEHLYDVFVVYQYRGKVKQIAIPYGKTRNGWVASSTADIVIMDDSAKVIRELKQAEDRK